MKDRSGMRSKIKLTVGIRRKVKIVFTGKLEKFINGKLVETRENTIATVCKVQTAFGAATGVMNAINKARFTWAGPTTEVVNVTKDSGGTGAEDYVVFKLELTPVGTITISGLELGYDLGGGGEKVFASVTGLSETVPAGDTIRYLWTITVGYDEGGVTDLYRYRIAKLLADGTFVIPGSINFIDTTPANNCEAASLVDGGDGIETYHTWGATYTAPPGGNTIDVLVISPLAVCTATGYSEDDIVDKALAESETLTAQITFEHNPT